jgi:hypothetical protein
MSTQRHALHGDGPARASRWYPREGEDDRPLRHGWDLPGSERSAFDLPGGDRPRYDPGGPREPPPAWPPPPDPPPPPPPPPPPDPQP